MKIFSLNDNEFSRWKMCFYKHFMKKSMFLTKKYEKLILLLVF